MKQIQNKFAPYDVAADGATLVAGREYAAAPATGATVTVSPPSLPIPGDAGRAWFRVANAGAGTVTVTGVHDVVGVAEVLFVEDAAGTGWDVFTGGTVAKGTLHDLGNATAIALKSANDGFECHNEGGAGFSITATDCADGDRFRIINTSGAVATGGLTFAGFAGAFLRDGTTDTTLASPFDIGKAKAYDATITNNGGNYYLNLVPFGGAATAGAKSYPFGDGAATTFSIDISADFPPSEPVLLQLQDAAGNLVQADVQLDPATHIAGISGFVAAPATNDLLLVATGGGSGGGGGGSSALTVSADADNTGELVVRNADGTLGYVAGFTAGIGAGNQGRNTAYGNSALAANTTGNDNTASGNSALLSNTTGNRNTANGASALSFNTTGRSNTASGVGALFFSATGNSNTASGANALNRNTTGNDNTASGVGALAANTTGSNNTASGNNALNANTTGSGNTCYGSYDATGRVALNNNLYVAIGQSAATTANIRLHCDDLGNARLGGGLVASPTISGTLQLGASYSTVEIPQQRTIASSTATGRRGEVCWDSNFIYVCTAANTWKRAALASW